jgi:tetratricopeptide (TPR) repeat protein/predicted Ser/Thr protein kinase
METTPHNRRETLDGEDRTEGASNLDAPDLTPGDTFEPTLEGDSPDSPDTPPIERVDRFRLERVLGSGGMGTVYEGWDEKLQRRVALKFLRRTTNPGRSEKRFYREAQGLARISHPHVVPVYDVGRWNERVWIAMEYVPGQTLGDWAAAAPRSNEELLEKWLDVGRGLAAIHDAGLIHRDIKPSNILVGDDGRVRIVDFGLVKAADTRRDSGEVEMSTKDSGTRRRSSSNSQLSNDLTEVRGFLGTAGYAAPEQQDGREVDPCSDQYSFCVGLWEALCGARPPRQERDRKGLVPLPVGVRLPKRLHLALSRGLSLEARARFADMHGLLAALTPPPRRWLAPTIAAVVTALFAACVGYVLNSDEVDPLPPADDPCAEAAAPIEAIWTSERRQSLANQVDVVSTRATQFIEKWVDGWSNAATTSCEDVHVRQLYSEQAQDRRATCLARSLDSFEAFMLAVDEGSVTETQQLIEWLGVLREPEACLSEAVLRSNYETVPEEFSEEIALLRRQLIGTGVSGKSDYQQRLRVAQHVVERAREIGDKLLLGEASLTLGLLRIKLYDISGALADIGRTLDIGTVMGDAELCADAWSALFVIESRVEFDLPRASWVLDRQEALFDKVEPGPRRRARLLRDRAEYYVLDSQFEKAEATQRKALQLYDSAGLTQTWDRAEAMHALGSILSKMGRSGEAFAAYDAASGIESDGSSNPARETSAAKKLLDESIALVEAGELAEGRARAQAGLELAIAQQGCCGATVMNFHVVLAAICQELGDRDCLRTHAVQANEISLIAYGPTSLARFDVLSAVGIVAINDGRVDVAVTTFQQALDIAQRHTAADSLHVGLAESNLGGALSAAGQIERAASLTVHALEILQARLSPDHHDLGPVFLQLGEIELERKNLDAACRSLERAAAITPDSDTQTRSRIDELLPRCGK